MNKTEKVLYIVNIPSPYRISFFNELGKLCDLTVLFERKSSSERETSWHDYNFENFKGFILKGINFQSDKSINISVIRYLSKTKYDHIIIGGYATPTGALAINYLKYKRIPFILNIDGGIEKEHESRAKKTIKKYLISSANAYLSTGKVASKYLEYYGAKPENIHIYPFTTLKNEDLLKKVVDKQEKIKIREDMGIAGDMMILTVGQFIHRKGFDILMKACSKIDFEASIYFVGGKPTQEYLDLKENLKLDNIHFVGFKTKDEILKYYRAADLFVLPTREDIWGLVINEAMASGLPVLTTDMCVAGLELIENYVNGFIVPVDDEVALSARINDILGDEELIKEMSQNSLTRAKNYTIENMASETMSILTRIKKSRVYDE